MLGAEDWKSHDVEIAGIARKALTTIMHYASHFCSVCSLSFQAGAEAATSQQGYGKAVFLSVFIDSTYACTTSYYETSPMRLALFYQKHRHAIHPTL